MLTRWYAIFLVAFKEGKKYYFAPSQHVYSDVRAVNELQNKVMCPYILLSRFPRCFLQTGVDCGDKNNKKLVNNNNKKTTSVDMGGGTFSTTVNKNRTAGSKIFKILLCHLCLYKDSIHPLAHLSHTAAE